MCTFLPKQELWNIKRKVRTCERRKLIIIAEKEVTVSLCNAVNVSHCSFWLLPSNNVSFTPAFYITTLKLEAIASVTLFHTRFFSFQHHRWTVNLLQSHWFNSQPHRPDVQASKSWAKHWTPHWLQSSDWCVIACMLRGKKALCALIS